MTANARDIFTKVDRGVLLLDQFAPGWEKKVKIKTFDIRNGEACILGQAFGTYLQGQRKVAQTAIVAAIKSAGLRLQERSLQYVEIDPVYYGFNVDGDIFGSNRNKQYSLLAERWNAVLVSRADARRNRGAGAKGTKKTKRKTTKRKTTKRYY